MSLRLVLDKRLCLKRSLGGSKLQVWLHDERQIVFLGLVRSQNRGLWHGYRPDGTRVIHNQSLELAIKGLAVMPLVE